MNWRGYALVIILALTTVTAYVVNPILEEYHNSEMIQIFKEVDDIMNPPKINNELQDEFIESKSRGLKKRLDLIIDCDRGFLLVRNKGSPFFSAKQYVRDKRRRCWIT